MNARSIALVAAIVFTAAAHAQTGTVNTVAEAPMCRAAELALSTDDRNGDYNGMSHSGTLLILHNASTHACRAQPFPAITFADDTHPLAATGTVEGTAHMGHGPVVLPIVISAGADVTSKLRWVSGEVYDKNVCITPTKLTVKIGEGTLSTAAGGHICGDGSKGPASYTFTRWATDTANKP